MASSPEYVRFVADQLSQAGGVTYKKLFGEYGLWRGGKFFGTVEDDQFYVKPTEAGRQLATDVYNRHCLLTDFLLFLGVSDPVAREDACKIEHDLSPESYQCLKKFMEQQQSEKS